MRQLQYKLVVLALSALVLLPAGAQRRVEYFWDTDPGVGKGKVLGQFTGTQATLTNSLDVGQLSPGIHFLGLRTLNTAKDAKITGSNNYVSQTGDNKTKMFCSATYTRAFFIPASSESITRIEYSWDTEAAPGKGTALQFTTNQNIASFDSQLSVGNLPTGLHTLYVRTIAKGIASKTYARTFYVPAAVHKIQAVEYFFDKDPGVGRATRMAATLAADGDTLKKAFDVNTQQLSDGIHLIGLRTLTDGTWSETKTRRFLVRSVVENQVTRLEYFWNNDPGANNGYVVDITPGKELAIDFEADMTELGEGPHTLGLRARSGLYNWSPAKLVSGIEFEGWDNLQEYLDSFEDTQDQLASGKYTRQYKNLDWHALYVPFTLNYGDWADHFDVARINAFYQYDDDEDGVVDRQVLEAIIVKGGNGALKANYPYLIRAKQKGNYTLNVGTSRQVAQAINSVSCSTMEAKYTFTGNYSQLKGLKTAQRYRLRGGSLSIPESDDEVLPPYRWYLTIDNLGNQLQPSASRTLDVRIVGEDSETTGIDATLNENGGMVNEKAYDLQGRRIKAPSSMANGQLKKGLYIINNKKYIAK